MKLEVGMYEEIYKDIVGYEGYYQVSNLGNVKSLDRVVDHAINGPRKVKGRILTNYFYNLGYLTVTLTKRNKTKVITVEAFESLEHKL